MPAGAPLPDDETNLETTSAISDLAPAQGAVETVKPLTELEKFSSVDDTRGSETRTELSLGEIPDTRSQRARQWRLLESITVKNFKAAQDATIPLDRLTILVGPNGCGKSSVLQAIHWGARAASYIIPKNTKEMISFDRLDYLPSSEPLQTLYKGELKTDSTSTPVEITFSHRHTSDDPHQVNVKIRAARNRGGITVYIEGGAAVTPYKQRFQFLTTYIPGLAGLSERETILAQPSLRRQAASGDAGGVLRNILLNLRSRRTSEQDDTDGVRRLEKLNQLVREVHNNIEIDVSFDEREDYHISAFISILDSYYQVRPLEMAATGVLQTIQIFAYLILFEPKIMLIDEPDAHLHPDKQERLVEALERSAIEFDTQIILTTHSPHIVRAASPSAKLVWMKDGLVATEDDTAIRRILGWGGLDKSVLLFVEDEDDKAIRAIVRQWPDISRQISICRCFGIDNLPRDKFLEGLLVDGQLKLKTIIHRDRDFMTDIESDRWKNSFRTNGVFPWITKGCDVEYYFCDASYLSSLYGITIEEADSWRTEAVSGISKVHETFNAKRKIAIRTIWPDGGAPLTDDLWREWGEKSPLTVIGKDLYKSLKVIAKNKGKDSKLLDKYHIPENYEMATDLRSIIVNALQEEI
ncbi:MAG: ATP-binding protein [Pseudomonadota bacterium]